MKESTFKITMTMLVDATTAKELQGIIDNEDYSHIVANMATDIHATIEEQPAGSGAEDDDEEFVCSGCGREESTCSNDPCDGVLEDRRAGDEPGEFRERMAGYQRLK